MYYRQVEKRTDLYFDTNTLFFSDKLKQKSFTETFNVIDSFGNLSEFQTKIPTLILDLAPDFNIKNQYKNQKEDFLVQFQEELQEFPYFTHLYKDTNINKNTLVIDESEYSYNSIFTTYKEILYILDNIYQNKKDVLIIHFGKYAEYKYLFSMLNYQNWDKKLHFLYCKHPSNYIEKGFLNNKNYKADIIKIKKIMEEY